MGKTRFLSGTVTNRQRASVRSGGRRCRKQRSSRIASQATQAPEMALTRSIIVRNQLPRRVAMAHVGIILPRCGAVMPVIAGGRPDRWRRGRNGRRRCRARGLRQRRYRQSGDRQQGDRRHPVVAVPVPFVLAELRRTVIRMPLMMRMKLRRRSLMMVERHGWRRRSMIIMTIVVLMLGKRGRLYPHGNGKSKAASGFDRFHKSGNDAQRTSMTVSRRTLQPFVTV